jgi:hypothetical protein
MTPQQLKAMKLALEALKLNNKEWKSLADSGDAGYWKAEGQDHYKQTEEAITAIKEVLAEHAMQERGAWQKQLTNAQRNELKQIEDGTWEADRNG